MWQLEQQRHACQHFGPLEAVRLDVDPDTEVGELTLGERPLVAIARLLRAEAEVNVLDETTAALTRGEGESLFKKLRPFTGSGPPRGRPPSSP